MNNSRNKKMITILGVLIVMLLGVALYMTYFQLFEAKFYADHDYNSRNWVDESSILRGTIRDADGNSLAYSQKNEDGSMQRINAYYYMYTPIIGYTDPELGKSGIEQKYNKELLNIPDNYDFISQLESAYNRSERGKDVYLTIDSDIQSYMYDLLEGYKGAIVVIEPSTGNIVSMISRPSFNVNRLKENWNSLIESDDGVLINRATQGLYTPGSIFKIISSIALLENNVDLDYIDNGSTTINGYTISNYANREYGEIDLRKALIHSSNTYFSDKSKELDNIDLLRVTNSFMLGKAYDFDVNRSLSRIPYKNNLDELEKAVTAFGQGKTMVTPLDMASMVAAIANDGIMMKPRLVNKTLDGEVITEFSPVQLSKAVPKDINDRMVDYLTDTATENNRILDDGTKLAGKSGTAETDTLEHSWYVGFGPAESPRYAIAIVLEHAGVENSQGAGRIFNRAMEFLLRQ